MTARRIPITASDSDVTERIVPVCVGTATQPHGPCALLCIVLSIATRRQRPRCFAGIVAILDYGHTQARLCGMSIIILPGITPRKMPTHSFPTGNITIARFSASRL